MSLLRCRAGAAMVFGIFFAVFLIACVYALYGTIETVLYRQHVQDAADAAAFSAAVVNARGMNLIALINMTMAVVLSILVGLRLAETLGYIAMGVCLALSSVTFGATASAVPPLQTATNGIAQAAENVKDPIENILKVLHVLGKAASVAVPLGANVRVIDLVASRYDAFGAAIPARLTLPVEDDDFSVLCGHAGKIAGELAIKPLGLLLPDPVERKMGDVVGKIAAAGSSWFCGQGGTPPNLNPEEDTQWIELPRFDSQDECDARARTRIDPNEDEAALREPCERANAEQLSSVPDRNGRCRAGENLCPTDCQGSARESCPPAEFGSCRQERSIELSSSAQRLYGSSTVTCGEGSPYQRRLALARSQCLPESEGGRSGLGGFAWLERSVTREYRWERATARWVEDSSARSESEIHQVRRKDADTAHPCGSGGAIGTSYQKDTSLPVCESEASCLSGPYLGAAGSGRPCSRQQSTVAGLRRFREQSTEVVDVLRCAYKTENPQVQTPGMDLNKDFPAGNSQQSGQQTDSGDNTNPFRLEQGQMLGASDFQLRSVVIAKQAPSRLQQVVALAWWGGPRGDEVGEQGGGVASLMTKLGRIGLAQAEYYFDWVGLGAEAPDDQTKGADVTEWMWNMGWRARLRPFRLQHGDADPEQSASQSGPKAPAGQGSSGGQGDKPQQALDCEKLPSGAGAFCGDAQSAVDLFGGGSGP